MSCLPKSVESHVVCEHARNLGQFRVPNLHVLRLSPVRYLWDKSLRKLGMRRHLGYLSGRLKALKADVLHSHFGTLGWANLEAAKRAGVRHVVSFYGVDMSAAPRLEPRWRVRYRTLFELVDRVLCEGPCMARGLASLGCPEAKIVVQRLGVRLDSIRFAPRSLRPGEPLKALIASSFREKKGIPLALKALARLREEADLEVTLIGEASPEERSRREKERILRAADGLGRAVRFRGFLSHDELLRDAYRHHLFVAASRTASDGDCEGGAPMVIAEMAASGMPVVSTRHCDIPELIEDGVSGLLAVEGDEESLLGCLRRLAKEPERWGEYGRAARARMEERFDAAEQGRALAAVYRSLGRA